MRWKRINLNRGSQKKSIGEIFSVFYVRASAKFLAKASKVIKFKGLIFMKKNFQKRFH